MKTNNSFFGRVFIIFFILTQIFVALGVFTKIQSGSNTVLLSSLLVEGIVLIWAIRQVYIHLKKENQDALHTEKTIQ